MLTIRFIGTDGGEFVRLIQSVHYIPPTEVSEGLDLLSICDEKGDHQNLYEGTAFVMNENGKTVATYRLMSPPELVESKPSSVGRKRDGCLYPWCGIDGKYCIDCSQSERVS